MKLFDMFDQTPHHTLAKIIEKLVPMKKSISDYRKKQKIIT